MRVNVNQNRSASRFFDNSALVSTNVLTGFVVTTNTRSIPAIYYWWFPVQWFRSHWNITTKRLCLQLSVKTITGIHPCTDLQPKWPASDTFSMQSGLGCSSKLNKTHHTLSNHIAGSELLSLTGMQRQITTCVCIRITGRGLCTTAREVWKERNCLVWNWTHDLPLPAHTL